MSTLDAGRARLSADDRYELAMRAQNQQRLNAPRHLIVLGVIFLLISIIAFAIAWQTQRAAQEKNAQAARDLANLENIIAQIQTLQAAQIANPNDENLRPLPGILSTFENLGERAGLERVALPQNQGSRIEGQAVLKTYPYNNVRSHSLENLLSWVRLAEQEIPGLHVRELTIEPRSTAWSMDVVLARYERRQ